MNIKINYKELLILIVVTAGLIYLTDSYLMTAGILLLLIVVEHMILDKVAERQARKAREEKDKQHASPDRTL